MSRDLPLIGAALFVKDLEALAPWLIEGQRDIEVQDFFSAEVLEGDWKGLVAETRRLLDGHTGRIGIHGPFWGFSVATPDPDVRDVVRKRLRQGLDACVALGGTHMVVHSPYTTWDYNNLDKDFGARTRVIEYSHAAMADAVRQAEDHGITLVIENIEDIDPLDRVHLARSFDSSAVAVSIDTGHAHYAHGSNGAPPVDYYVLAAGETLQHVHIQDADGYADRHWVPGEGTVRWHSVFAALATLPQSPRLVLELADNARLRDGANWLIAQGLAR
jgi:sugar phosphate isomerase/epimerase